MEGGRRRKRGLRKWLHPAAALTSKTEDHQPLTSDGHQRRHALPPPSSSVSLLSTSSICSPHPTSSFPPPHHPPSSHLFLHSFYFPFSNTIFIHFFKNLPYNILLLPHFLLFFFHQSTSPFLRILHLPFYFIHLFVQPSLLRISNYLLLLNFIFLLHGSLIAFTLIINICHQFSSSFTTCSYICHANVL